MKFTPGCLLGSSRGVEGRGGDRFTADESESRRGSCIAEKEGCWAVKKRLFTAAVLGLLFLRTAPLQLDESHKRNMMIDSDKMFA